MFIRACVNETYKVVFELKEVISLLIYMFVVSTF